MSRRSLLVIFLILVSTIAFAEQHYVALSFDDGPIMKTRAGIDAATRNRAILRQLREAKIKAILLYTTYGFTPDRLTLVRQWGIEGHSIGNHTATHPNFDSKQVSLQGYKNELLSCDSVISSLPGYVKRFRFSYLKEGNTIEKRDGFRDFMKQIGYRPAPVSIDASDGFYSDRLVKRLEQHPNQDLEPYKQAYLNHIWSRSLFYDSLSVKYLGRSVKHVLLLHHNQINAFFLADVIKMYRTRGWQVIDPEEAFTDSIYQCEPYSFPSGESILRHIAVDHGEMNLRYPGEDGSYEKPIMESLKL